MNYSFLEPARDELEEVVADIRTRLAAPLAQARERKADV